MSRSQRRGLYGLGCGLSALAALLRQPGKWSWKTVWAEDGAVYISEALHQSWWRTPFRGYAGYFQLVPRILVLPVRWLPASTWAAYCAVTAALVTAVLAMLIHHWSEGWVRHWGLRLVVPALVVLAPVAFQEITADLTNLGWPLLVASVWAVLACQHTRREVAGRVGVVVATALSTTVAVLLVPFAIGVARWRRTRADVVVAASLVAASVVQGVTDLFLEQRPKASSTASDLPVELAVRVAGIAVVGVRWLDRLWEHERWWFAIASLAVIAAFVVLCQPRSQPRSRIAVATGLTGLAVLMYVVPVWIRGTAENSVTPGGISTVGSRYDYVPIILLVSALVVLVDAAPRRWLRAALVAQTAIVIVTSARLANVREGGPFWADSLAQARATCAQTADPAVALPISPEPPWSVIAPCSRMR